MNLAILGCGNMGQALACKMGQSKQNVNFFTFDVNHEKSSKLSQLIAGEIILDLSMLSQMDLILIACKPQQFKELADSIVSFLNY